MAISSLGNKYQDNPLEDFNLPKLLILYGEQPTVEGDLNTVQPRGVDLRKVLETLCMPVRMTSAFVSAPKTFTETPAEVFAGSSVLADRKYLVIRNESTEMRLRYGVSNSNLQRDGYALEPGAVAVIQFDPVVATTIYACSEGKAITCNIAEDAAS